ncbi:DNA-processing protein DprA, partial [Salinisphaera sp. SWV1]
MSDRSAWLRLATTPGIGATLAGRLVARFGSAQAALAGSGAGWRDARS